jgi:hypothetical protein
VSCVIVIEGFQKQSATFWQHDANAVGNKTLDLLSLITKVIETK